MQMSN